jgi:hypothetical protein
MELKFHNVNTPNGYCLPASMPLRRLNVAPHPFVVCGRAQIGQPHQTLVDVGTAQSMMARVMILSGPAGKTSYDRSVAR